jgi:acetylornithine deacetylase
MDPVEILSRLISINSGNPPGDCNKIAEYVANLIRNRTKARVARQKTPDGNVNVIAILGQPRFFINCHLDTVPAGPDRAAYKLRRKNGKLYGLGATDVKGPIAALLSALIHIPPRNLMLIFSCDEENGKNTGIRAFLASRYARGLAAGIVTEPTLLHVVRYHPGVCNFELSFPGRAAHSAYPDQGINAIERAAGFITKLTGYRKKLIRYRDRGLDPTLNVAIIKGGVKSNVVPDLCALKINFRNPPGLTPARIRRDLQRLCGDKKTVVKETYSAPPLRMTGHSSVIANMLRSCGAHDGASAVNYWSEAALFSKAGIPACVFGPGDIAQAHRPDEFIRVRDMLEGQAVYRRLFNKL